MITNKGIFKIITLFASVQVAVILTQVIRSKFISIYLGPEGIGTFSLYNSLFSFFFTLIGLGIDQGILNVIPSLIRENFKKVNNFLPLINLIVFTTLFLFGLIIVFFLDEISNFVFENLNQSSIIIYLLLGSVFTTLATIRLSFIQSYQLNDLIVKIKLYHAIISTVLVICLIYFFKFDGILISIIVGSIIYYLVSLFFSKKILKYDFIKIKDLFELLKEKNIRSILNVGLVLLLGQFVGQILLNYGNLIVLNYGEISDVGYWTAARTIIINYAGLIFVALNIEFLPRISSIKNEINLLEKNVEIQLKVLSILTFLLSITLYIFSDLIINILYSKDFLEASLVVKVAAISIPLNGVTYTISYLHLIKDFKYKYVIINSIFPGLIFIISGYFFNLYFGIVGLGISLTLTAVLHYFIVIYFTKVDLDLKIKNYFNLNLILSIVIILVLFSLEYIEVEYLSYFKTFILLFTFIYCFKQYKEAT